MFPRWNEHTNEISRLIKYLTKSSTAKRADRQPLSCVIIRTFTCNSTQQIPDQIWSRQFEKGPRLRWQFSDAAKFIVEFLFHKMFTTCRITGETKGSFSRFGVAHSSHSRISGIPWIINCRGNNGREKQGKKRDTASDDYRCLPTNPTAPGQRSGRVTIKTGADRESWMRNLCGAYELFWRLRN